MPKRTDIHKILVIGSGPIVIGQAAEFDYAGTQACLALKEEGYEVILCNSNPATIMTDPSIADKVYMEPLTLEYIARIVRYERPDAIIPGIGGQTGLNLAMQLEKKGILKECHTQLLGTPSRSIEQAEDRELFKTLCEDLGEPVLPSDIARTMEEGLEVAAEIGYPVLVRPSFVLGGRAMQIVSKEKDLRHYLKTAVEIDEDKPVLVDKYICGKEVEIDAVCDGRNVFVPGIMELVEKTGIHSGDSISVYPTFSIADKVKDRILDYAEKLGKGIGIRGLFNIQFIVDENDEVYIIEVNPRSSRTVPFLSKATGYQLADIATNVMLGEGLAQQGLDYIYPDEKTKWYVKAPAFSFSKLNGMDAYLSPEMKSTGEAIGYDRKLSRAMYKALIASGVKMQNYGTVIVTLADEDKEDALPLIKRFYNMGFNIEATAGTGEFLKANGVRTRIRGKLSEGSTEILDVIRAGYASYVINTRAIMSGIHYEDGMAIRGCAAENNVTMFTSLDTVRVLLDVLEEITIGVSTINEE